MQPLLLLSKLDSASGNASTAQRLCRLLAPVPCVLVDVSDVADPNQLQDLVKQHSVRLVLGVHAFRSGCLLPPDLAVPFVLVLGGTDVNECCLVPERLRVMTAAVALARHVVAFGPSMCRRFVELWPDYARKCVTIPQSIQPITVQPCRSCLETLNDLCPSLPLTESSKVFVLASGLRPVKDVLFLAPAFSRWHLQNRTCVLVIIGPVVDQAYACAVRAALVTCPGVVLLPPLETSRFHGFLQSAFALVNSSKSEGMSGAILEALMLRVPVLARHIAGNCDLVQHEKNGLLFQTEEDFVEQAQRLISDDSLRETLRENGFSTVRKRHDPDEERRAYTTLIAPS
eukprot:m.149286 g.149286  ORF g.149286 m.149286 type:complete len:343 (-) comp20626_c7_seq16:106-1134(-)